MKPRLRFKGFTHNWTLKRLKDIAQVVSGGTPSTSQHKYWNGSINWYSPDEISGLDTPYAYHSRRKITKDGLKHSSAKLMPVGTVLLTSRANVGDMAILKKPASTNQGFKNLELKNGISPYFIYSYKLAIKHNILRVAHGSTFLEISKNEMKNVKVYVPSSQEQLLIGNFFKILDKEARLYKEKSNLIKKLENAYKQKMFIR